MTQACATSRARWTGLDVPVGQSSKRQLASATSRVLVLNRDSLPWCIICSWWQPSGILRLAVVLLSPGERVKLRFTAAPLSGLTTSCRPSHPSPKLSNSCTRTRAAACSSGGATGCGGGSSGNGGRPTGGAEGSTEGGCVEGGGADGEAAGQTRAPKAASIKIAARTSLSVTRASSASVSESFSPCARRETRASRSSVAVRCIGSCGGSSHRLTVGPIPAAIWIGQVNRVR